MTMPNTPPDEPGSGVIRFRFREAVIIIPEDPSDEELALDWTLSDTDKRAVSQVRGEDNLRRFGIQLCIFRKYGRFLERSESVPPSILAYISRQLELPPVSCLSGPERQKTTAEYKKQILSYLSFHPFDGEAQKAVEEEILRIAVTDLYAENIPERIEKFLRDRKTVLPLRRQLESIVNTVYRKVEEDVFNDISGRIPEETKRMIDRFLSVQDGCQVSEMSSLDDYPPEAKPAKIADYLKKYNLLVSSGIGNVLLTGIPTELIKKLRDVARSHTSREIREFGDAKRYAVSVSYLHELRRCYLDNLVYMNKRYLNDIQRQAAAGHEEELRKARKKLRSGVAILLDVAVSAVRCRRSGRPMDEFSGKTGIDEIEEAIENCALFLRIEKTGCIDKLLARYSNFRKYFPEFLKLDFQAEPGSEYLLEAVETARKINSGELRYHPGKVTDRIVQASWKDAFLSEDLNRSRRVWELSLAIAIREALGNFSMFLPESRSNASFREILGCDDGNPEGKEHAYSSLNLDPDTARYIEGLVEEFNRTAAAACGRIEANSFVKIQKNGEVRFRKDEAVPVSPEVKKLRRLISSRIPKIRIEKMLKEVDGLCGLTDELRPSDRREIGIPDLPPVLRAAVTAHGTNLGISAVGSSNDKISVDMLQHVSRTCLSSESIRNANTRLVNFMNSLDTCVNMGSGRISSSDGQRFGVQGSSLIAAFYPRYFGYYDRAVTLYTLISRCSVLSTQVICCGDREAWYVLNGLLENDTDLPLGQHHTDTHGFSDHVFALCSLLDYFFMPRLKNLHRQTLYKIDRNAHYGPLEPMFKGTIDLELIASHRDDMVRLAAALKNRVVQPHAIMPKLAASVKHNPLSRALAELGKLLKTIYILRYINEEPVRRQVQRMLCYGEQRQSVANHIFFANRGMFRRGDIEEIMNKASCLSLLSNTVACWNCIHIDKIVKQLKKEGHVIKDETLEAIYPLFFEHVIVNGEYDFF